MSRAALLFALFLAACGDAPAPSGTANGTDAPMRIVSSAPGITEMVAYLGAADRLVAVSPWCDYPPEVKDLQRISVLPFDPEAALAAKPDLVIVDARLHRQNLAVIRKRVPSVLTLDTSRSLESVAESMTRLAEVLDDEEARARAKAWHEAMILTLIHVGRHRPDPEPRVLVVAQWDPLYVLGKGSLIDDMVEACGGKNIAWDLQGDASGTFSEELVLERRPDWILTPKEPMPERIKRRWRNVPAVKHGHIADGSADDLVRAGPRILDGLRRLARILQGGAK